MRGRRSASACSAAALNMASSAGPKAPELKVISLAMATTCKALVCEPLVHSRSAFHMRHIRVCRCMRALTSAACTCSEACTLYRQRCPNALELPPKLCGLIEQCAHPAASGAFRGFEGHGPGNDAHIVAADGATDS